MPWPPRQSLSGAPPNRAPLSYGTSGPAGNYFYNVGQTEDNRQFDVKVGYQLSDKNRLFARESYDWRLSLYAAPGDVWMQSSGNNPNSNNRTHNAVAGDTYTFAPTLVNELRLGFMRFYTTDYGNDYPPPENNALGIPNGNLPAFPNTYGVATLSITASAAPAPPVIRTRTASTVSINWWMA